MRFVGDTTGFFIWKNFDAINANFAYYDIKHCIGAFRSTFSWSKLVQSGIDFQYTTSEALGAPTLPT